VRLTGWILLLIGFVLCATIAWAAIGFLLMGLGLISLQLAERGRRRARLAAPGTVASAGFVPPVVGAGLQPPTFEPVAQRNGPPARQPRRIAWPAKSSDEPYDRDAWHRLVESDPDITRLVKVLADYGPQYVDELAISYLAAPDKNRLGGIVDGIIARAQSSQPMPPPQPAQGPQPPLPRPEPQRMVPPETARPAGSPPPPANAADALEATLIAAVEQASAKAAATRTDTPRPARPGAGPPPVETRPNRLPPLASSNPSADLEASLIAAVTEASAKRADPPKPAPPVERPTAAAARAPDSGVAPPPPRPASPPVGTPDDHPDEALLAALAEISGENLADQPKPDPASNEPPADDDLSEMIKKFAPDSSFLRKT
jgi:hypothetical protein